MSDASLNAFGYPLNIGVDVPTAVAGNGLGNSIGGGLAAGDHLASAGGHYHGFGNVNVAVDVPTVVSANGVGNVVGGSVLAAGGQEVGDPSFASTSPFGEVNVGVVTPTAVVANGVGNFIGGSVEGSGLQTVADLAAHHG